MYPCTHTSNSGRRFPRAGIDPITDEASAFGVIATQIHRPLRYETVCLFLDHAYCGRGFVVVSDTVDPDSVRTVVEQLTEHCGPNVGALAIASVRPNADCLDYFDDFRWLELEVIADQHSVELLEWWVVGAHVMQPRTCSGTPSKWPADR